ncbi:MAG: hypothetical protein ACLVAW_17115 [Eisenbergiella massiliensis]
MLLKKKSKTPAGEIAGRRFKTIPFSSLSVISFIQISMLVVSMVWLA